MCLILKFVSNQILYDLNARHRVSLHFKEKHVHHLTGKQAASVCLCTKKQTRNNNNNNNNTIFSVKIANIQSNVHNEMYLYKLGLT